jgi:hypothetical protein
MHYYSANGMWLHYNFNGMLYYFAEVVWLSCIDKGDHTWDFVHFICNYEPNNKPREKKKKSDDRVGTKEDIKEMKRRRRRRQTDKERRKS